MQLYILDKDPSKSLLPIDRCIEEYKKYLREFKGVEI